MPIPGRIGPDAGQRLAGRVRGHLRRRDIPRDTHSRKPVLQVRGGVVLAAPGGLTGVHGRGLEDAQPRQINVGDLQPASR